MTSQRTAEVEAAQPAPASTRRSASGAPLFCFVARLCAGAPVSETVTTQVHVDAGPESVWNRILFYEDVPRRPPMLLGALLPHPVRTQGDKTCIGANVQCIYGGGRSLAKRITAVQPPRLLAFEVIEQSLGIEECLITLGGCYQIERCGGASHVVLKTSYQARLHPRWLWRQVEAFLVSQLHTHILRGLSVAALSENRLLSPVALAPPRVPQGGLACKAQSCSHR